MKTYALGKLSSKHICHLFHSTKSTFRIIYKSSSLSIQNQKRLFRLNLYKVVHSYFNLNNFHYIAFKNNQRVGRKSNDSLVLSN